MLLRAPLLTAFHPDGRSTSLLLMDTNVPHRFFDSSALRRID
jgi:hypothetical protein